MPLAVAGVLADPASPKKVEHRFFPRIGLKLEPPRQLDLKPAIHKPREDDLGPGERDQHVWRF